VAFVGTLCYRVSPCILWILCPGQRQPNPFLFPVPNPNLHSYVFSFEQIGALTALEEAGIISVPEHISFVSGASAGALVGGMLAAGMKPSEMGEKVFAFKRNDFWDMGECSCL
jgi:hypothetical protein